VFTYFLALFLAAGPILSGRVADPQGTPIPNAIVRVDSDDGRSSVGVTDSRGEFRVEVNGRFIVEIRHSGFRTLRSAAASLLGASADDIYQATFSLLPGDVGDIETVELRLEAVSDPEARGEPGVREGLPKSDRLFGLRGGVNVTGIAEGSGQQWIASSGSVFTSSSISTAVTETSDFSAELGDTTSRTDSLPSADAVFHGSAYYFHRNDIFNARNFFDPPQSGIPPFKYHFFGTEAGGMPREGTYVYSQYWGLRIHQSITRAATVPDPAWLTGDFSSVPETILDPETGFAFNGNRIPEKRLNAAGLALARLFPAPNVAGTAVPNYRAVGKLDTAADSFGFRLDQRLSTSNEAFVEYQFNRDTTDDPFNLLSGITNLPSFGARDALQTQTARFNNTHIFSTTLIHQLRFSMNYLNQPRTILDSGRAPTPAILITGLSNLGHATNLPQERRNRSFEVLNDISWQHASSITKFGATIRYFPFHASLDLYNRGQYQFTGGIFSGNAFANLLLGLPTNALRLTGNTTRDFRTWTTSAYVQHDWRLLPRLLANAGMRYDYQTPFHEATGSVANFNPATGALESSPKTLYDPDRNNFGPRIGLSWQPLGNLVARAGYGIFYDTLAVGDSLFLLGLNPPFVHFDVKNNGPALPQFDLTTAFLDESTLVQPSIFSTSRHLPNPYIQQWNTSIELPVPGDVLVSLAYFGQKGTRLRRQINLNQPAAGPAGSLDDRRPYTGFKNIFQFETSASSIAHAAEVRAERRFRAGVAFVAAYRFSRSIDDATLISVLPQDSHSLRAERGLSDFHMKHRLVFSSVFNLPPWRFINGWQLQAIGTLQSGMPLSAVLGTDIAGTGSPIVNRPDLVGNPSISNPTPGRFFNPAAFRVPESGTFGNSGRNVIIGPGVQNVDMALLRTIRLSDFTRAQFRADFYNVFNHPNFVAPPSMQNFADSPDFGALFVARSPRIVQFGLKFLW
jgi:TonB-dependent receptor-like protein/carboxypeptidase family protein